MVAQSSFKGHRIKLVVGEGYATISVTRRGKTRKFYTDPGTALKRYLDLCRRARSKS